MSLLQFSCSEPITDPEVLESIKALPTEDDLPCDDGEPMETPRHREQMNILIESLNVHWADRTTYYVGGNMFVHYDPQNKRRFRGPDFFLVLDVEARERKSWVVWQEGMRFPELIIELLSDSTREEDTGAKKRLYERLFRTPEYYLYDPFSHELAAYHLRGPFYAEVQPDADGKVYSPLTGLYLAVRQGWLRWLTADEEVVPTPMELAQQQRQRAEQERLRAEQERLRAEQAEQLLAAYRQRFGSLE